MSIASAATCIIYYIQYKGDRLKFSQRNNFQSAQRVKKYIKDYSQALRHSIKHQEPALHDGSILSFTELKTQLNKRFIEEVVTDAIFSDTTRNDKKQHLKSNEEKNVPPQELNSNTEKG